MAHPRDILLSLGANARKSFSQNFLTSPHWISRLAETATRGIPRTTSFDEIWEIGPGLGAITRGLVDQAEGKPLTVFEIDTKLAAHIRNQFPSVKVVEGDVLEADFTDIAGGKKISLLSNLPYHLSSPILFQLVDHKSCFVQLVLTFQKEFADRLIAEPGDEAYGGLSIVSQMHFSMHSLGVLPAGAFFPAPAVASEALVLTPRKCEVADWRKFSEIIKTAFAHRRKKLSKNLAGKFPEFPWEEKIVALGFTSSARPEELSKEDYLKLCEGVLQ